jgi:hypothetical protein
LEIWDGTLSTEEQFWLSNKNRKEILKKVKHGERDIAHSFVVVLRIM